MGDNIRASSPLSVIEHDIAEFGRTQIEFVRMLLVLVPVSSLIFGMALRLAVTYASRVFRDRWVYRVIVPIMSLLACACIAAQLGLVFQTATVSVQRTTLKITDRSAINVLGQVSVTGMSVIARGFFIARMWELNRNVYILWTAIFLWLAATSLLIGWEVDFAKGGMVQGSSKVWANLGSWSLVICAAFVGTVLFIELRKLVKPSLQARPLHERAVAYARILIESSGLICMTYLASSVTQAFRADSQVARLTSYFTFLLGPLVSIFSVLFSLVSRPTLPVTPRSSSAGSRTKRSNSILSRGAELFSLNRFRCSGAHDVDPSGDGAPTPLPAMLETNSQSRPTRNVVFSDYDAAAAGDLQPDDPRTWRGDAGRLFPDLRFDPEHSLASGPTSVSFRGGTDFDTFSMSQDPVRRGSSTPMLGRSPTASSIRATTSAPVVPMISAYDEDMVDKEPTVMRLDLNALQLCDPLVWGPKRRNDEEEGIP